jgi:hypothetical protein
MLRDSAIQRISRFAVERAEQCNVPPDSRRFAKCAKRVRSLDALPPIFIREFDLSTPEVLAAELLIELQSRAGGVTGSAPALLERGNFPMLSGKIFYEDYCGDGRL